MKYIIGRIGTSIGGEFKTRFTKLRCIDADTEEIALRIYNKDLPSASHFFSRCIGMMNEKNELTICSFMKKYPNFEKRPTAPGVYNFLVTKLLEEPNKLTEFSLYVPAVVQAKSQADAIIVYESLYSRSDRFKTQVLGYLDANNNFIVPNILDYIAQ